MTKRPFFLTAAVLGGAGLLVAAATTAGPARSSAGMAPAADSRAAHGVAGRTARATGAAATSHAPQLHVSGNKLVSAGGARIVLHGVDRAGTEYACVQGWGIFDGPSTQASLTVMKTWHINAVRVPLNQACWNHESYVSGGVSGTAYRNAVKAYVRLLTASGMVAILDLHWTDGTYTGPSAGCSSWRSVCQKPMPGTGAIRFWSSVAHAFKGNNAVIFDLFNEPYPERAAGASTSEGWRCWLHGGTCAGISYQVAGMQALVNAVRATGAKNVLMLGGLEYSNDLTGWLAHEPTDPDHNLVASWHSYNFNACSTRSCWNSQIAPVIKRVPLIAGEVGENDCAASYLGSLLPWLDARSASYLAWTWDDWSGGCASGPALITNYTGGATAYGAGYRAHLTSLAG
ncbi:MAG TPA: cellulase family glycosylhydrolase [Streptosporangiaceae bacterium]